MLFIGLCVIKFVTIVSLSICIYIYIYISILKTFINTETSHETKYCRNSKIMESRKRIIHTNRFESLKTTE